MNLLALLECRPPPAIPLGIGIVHSSDDPRDSGLPEEGPRENNRVAKQRENRAKVLEALQSGMTLSKDIEQHAGLCKSSVFNHCNILEAEGLVRIHRGKWINTYHLAKPKKSTRKVAK